MHSLQDFKKSSSDDSPISNITDLSLSSIHQSSPSRPPISLFSSRGPPEPAHDDWLSSSIISPPPSAAKPKSTSSPYFKTLSVRDLDSTKGSPIRDSLILGRSSARAPDRSEPLTTKEKESEQSKRRTLTSDSVPAHIFAQREGRINELIADLSRANAQYERLHDEQSTLKSRLQDSLRHNSTLQDENRALRKALQQHVNSSDGRLSRSPLRNFSGAPTSSPQPNTYQHEQRAFSSHAFLQPTLSPENFGPFVPSSSPFSVQTSPSSANFPQNRTAERENEISQGTDRDGTSSRQFVDASLVLDSLDKLRNDLEKTKLERDTQFLQNETLKNELTKANRELERLKRTKEKQEKSFGEKFVAMQGEIDGLRKELGMVRSDKENVEKEFRSLQIHASELRIESHSHKSALTLLRQDLSSSLSENQSLQQEVLNLHRKLHVFHDVHHQHHISPKIHANSPLTHEKESPAKDHLLVRSLSVPDFMNMPVLFQALGNSQISENQPTTPSKTVSSDRPTQNSPTATLQPISKSVMPQTPVPQTPVAVKSSPQPPSPLPPRSTPKPADDIIASIAPPILHTTNRFRKIGGTSLGGSTRGGNDLSAAATFDVDDDTSCSEPKASESSLVDSKMSDWMAQWERTKLRIASGSENNEQPNVQPPVASKSPSAATSRNDATPPLPKSPSIPRPETRGQKSPTSELAQKQTPPRPKPDPTQAQKDSCSLPSTSGPPIVSIAPNTSSGASNPRFQTKQHEQMGNVSVAPSSSKTASRKSPVELSQLLPPKDFHFGPIAHRPISPTAVDLNILQPKTGTATVGSASFEPKESFSKTFEGRTSPSPLSTLSLAIPTPKTLSESAPSQAFDSLQKTPKTEGAETAAVFHPSLSVSTISPTAPQTTPTQLPPRSVSGSPKIGKEKEKEKSEEVLRNKFGYKQSNVIQAGPRLALAKKSALMAFAAEFS